MPYELPNDRRSLPHRHRSHAHCSVARLLPAMATTSVAASSPHPHLSRPRRRNSSATSRTSIRGCLLPIRCSSASSSQPPATGGEEGESGRRRLSKQSSWEDRDVEGDDYLYRLGKEADNLNITVGARSGIVDELFVGNFLGKDCTCSETRSALLQSTDSMKRRESQKY
jgi:hypothetical protein